MSPGKSWIQLFSALVRGEYERRVQEPIDG
jgi:hypothetical protein